MNGTRPSIVVAVLTLTIAADAAPVNRGRNLVVNPGFESGEGWQPIGNGFIIDESIAHGGRRSLRCTGENREAVAGARQVITFDPPLRHPFRISAWSRARNAEVEQDYNIYLDLHYDDGTPLWGQTACFEPGTYDWQQAALTFDVARPVKTIEVYLLFRKASGTVWFDDVDVSLAPFQIQDLKLLPDVYGPGTLAVSARTSLPADWHAILQGPDGPVAEQHGSNTPILLNWAPKPPPSTRPAASEYQVRITATDTLLQETIRLDRPVRLAQPAAPTRGYAVWTESSMKRVMPHSLPSAPDQPPTAKIALAGREYEAFQVVLLCPPDRRLESVEVEVGDLVCRDNGRRIAAEHIEWHQVGYVKVATLRPHPADSEGAPGWWPDPLLSVKTFNVAGGFAQPVWVTVYAPPNTPAGRYVGRLTVRPRNAAPSAVDIEVEVYGFDLPVQGHLKTAFALMDGFLERTHGKPLDPDLRRRYGDFVLRHRLNPDDISRTAPPAIEDLVHYRDRGLNAFNVLNMVEEREDRTWVCWSPLEVYTPAFKQRLTERLDPFVEQLHRNDLIDRAYIYTFDERGKDFYPIMREYFGLVRQRYPGIRTLTTAAVPQDPAVMRDLNVDWNCPLTPAYRLAEADRCRAAGLQVWAYICLGPGYPYANWLANHPLIEARVIWWQAWQQRMDGFLYWGLNIWDSPGNDRPVDPARGPLLDWSITTGGEYDWLHGDGRLLYAGKDGPIGSIRLANIRDGLEDYEYLWLLQHQARTPDPAQQACLPVTANLTTFTRNPQVLYAQREALARQIRWP